MKKINFNRLFGNDILLKLFSLILAIIIWFIVVTLVVQDTVISISQVPVDIDTINSSLASYGLSLVEDSDLSTTVVVSGKSYTVGLLSASDFKATVDLSPVTKPGEYTLDLNVEKRETNASDYDVLYAKPNTITLTFDRYIEKTFELEASLPSLTFPEGYVLEQLVVSPSTIKLTGPESEINQIVSCVVLNDDKINIEGSTSIEGNLVFYGENNQKLDLPHVTYDAQKFTITAPLYIKQKFALTFDYLNVPAGFDVTSLTYNMSVREIEVAIPVDAVTSVNSISLGTIDFRKIDIGSVFKFDVSLLAGYININNVNEVTIEFPSENMQSEYLSTENIVLTNVPANYNIELMTTNISDIKMIGTSDVIEQLTQSDIQATINFANVQLSEGEKRVEVNITTANGEKAWAFGEYSVLVKITNKTT